jgi:hypothetical protein
MYYLIYLFLGAVAAAFYSVGFGILTVIIWASSGILTFAASKTGNNKSAILGLAIGVVTSTFMFVTYNFCDVENQRYCTMAQVDTLQKTQWEQLKSGKIKELTNVKWKEVKDLKVDDHYHQDNHVDKMPIILTPDEISKNALIKFTGVPSAMHIIDNAAMQDIVFLENGCKLYVVYEPQPEPKYVLKVTANKLQCLGNDQGNNQSLVINGSQVLPLYLDLRSYSFREHQPMELFTGDSQVIALIKKARND